MLLYMDWNECDFLRYHATDTSCTAQPAYELTYVIIVQIIQEFHDFTQGSSYMGHSLGAGLCLVLRKNIPKEILCMGIRDVKDIRILRRII